MKLITKKSIIIVAIVALSVGAYFRYPLIIDAYHEQLEKMDAEETKVALDELRYTLKIGYLKFEATHPPAEWEQVISDGKTLFAAEDDFYASVECPVAIPLKNEGIVSPLLPVGKIVYVDNGWYVPNEVKTYITRSDVETHINSCIPPLIDAFKKQKSDAQSKAKSW